MSRRIGFELELLAPPGKTRYDLAVALAARFRGRVEPSLFAHNAVGKRPGYSATRSFHVVDNADRTVARLVDDVTIKADLDDGSPPLAGWGQILGEDWHLIRKLARAVDPSQPVERWLEPLRQSHRARTCFNDASQSGVARDQNGNLLATVANQPGDRARAAEVVSPVLTAGHDQWLAAVVEEAAALGFTLPHEAATHLHFDATPFMSARAVVGLVEGFAAQRDHLVSFAGTNPGCTALGPWPEQLFECVRTPGFEKLAWNHVVDLLSEVGLVKECDLNIRGLLGLRTQKTIEFRFFPGSMDVGQIVDWANTSAECLHSWVRGAGEPSPYLPPTSCTRQ